MEHLTSSDRCDRCIAQAYVRVSCGNLVLDFCGHHYHMYDETLDNQGWSIALDVRDLLLKKPVGAKVS